MAALARFTCTLSDTGDVTMTCGQGAHHISSQQLQTSRTLVEALEQSIPEQGTEFTLVLPEGVIDTWLQHRACNPARDSASVRIQMKFLQVCARLRFFR
jgi:hypothetical protein